MIRVRVTDGPLIRQLNCQRFYDNVVADFKKCCEIAEILHNLSPKGREGLLDNFGIERLIDWDYSDRYKSWYEGQFERKIPEPDYEPYYATWLEKACTSKRVGEPCNSYNLAYQLEIIECQEVK